MNYYKTINNSLVEKKGYLCAILGLVVIFICWISLDLSSNYYKTSISFELLKDALNEKQHDRATEISVSHLDPSFSIKIMKRIFPSYSNLHYSLPATYHYKIFGIESLIDKNDLNGAKDNLKIVKKALKSYGFLENTTVLGSLETIEKQIKTLQLENKNFSEYKTYLEDLEAKKIRILRRHSLLADEFGIFLSLSPNYKKGTELKTYSKGVLYGLPVLKDLQDDISSLPILKEELDKIGGEVNIEAQNAYEVFAGRVLSIREASKKMRKNFDEVTSNIKLTKNEKSATKKSIEALKKSLNTNIEKLILSINS